jgi:general secretion pathway protein N
MPWVLRVRAIGRCGAGVFVLLAATCGELQPSAFAATESIDTGVMTPTTDPPQAERTPAAIVRPGGQATRMPAGNPLWAIPLRLLTGARDRPLFSPSRRPPPAAVAAAPAIVPVRQAARPAAPDHPLLTLVGTVVGDRQSIGVFVDQVSKGIIRLRTGQDHDGWTLRAVHERDAIFDNGRHEAILALPARDAKDQPASLAVNQALALPAGTWMDGDGQLISPPKFANGTVSRPSAHPAAATWRDGDGQLITPPTHN